MRIWLSRSLSWLAAAVVGGVFGLAGTIAHSLQWGGVPVGLLIGALACLSILVAVRSLTNDRATTIAASVGMLGMLTIISGVGPGGSVIVENTIWGQVWIYVVAGIALLVIAWPKLPAQPARVPAAAVVDNEPPQALITGVPRH